ncbi:MAG TPA: acyl-CoA thioesterase domain-containing protein [Trebonia sp.]
MTDLPSIPELLDLELVETDVYRSQALYEAPWAMFGGQAAAQALYAAGLTVDADRLPHSLHGYFVRRGDTTKPTLFRVDRDRDGRSFSARRVVALQGGEVIFSMSASFAAPPVRREAFPDEEAEAVPDLPPVDSLAPWSNPKHPSFEFRPADREKRLPNRFWLRCTDDLPDNPLAHAAVLAFTSDISTALIPFESEGISTGPSLDHAVWFHRPARMDDWHWQELTPRTAAGGRGWYTVGIYTPDGTRVASVTQEQLFAFRRPR